LGWVGDPIESVREDDFNNLDEALKGHSGCGAWSSGHGFPPGALDAGGKGEAGFFDGDSAGGAGDVLEVGEEGVEQGGLADRGAELADAGVEEFFQNGIEGGEEQGGLAAGVEIGGIGGAEGLDSGGAVGVAEGVVVHGGSGGVVVTE
jgi:hypothetical protein